MEEIVSSDTLETLQQVNKYLHSALLRLRPERKHSSTIKPQEFTDILGQLVRASECLLRPSAKSEQSPAVEKETDEYRKNLGKLRQFSARLARAIADREVATFRSLNSPRINLFSENPLSYSRLSSELFHEPSYEL